MRWPAKVARMLALAHHLQSPVDRGLVTDRAAVARRLGFTRARVIQQIDLLPTAPDLQLAVLALQSVDGGEPIAERTLRVIAHAGNWEEQPVCLQAHLKRLKRDAAAGTWLHQASVKAKRIRTPSIPLRTYTVR